MKSTARRHARLGFASVKLPVAALLAMTLVATSVRAATIVSTATGGNWADTATWVGGVVPSSTDDAQIVSGATITVLNNTAANSITFLSSRTNTGTLSVSSGASLNVTGGITLQNAATNKVSAVISGAGVINCASLDVAGTTIPALGNLTTILTSTIASLNIAGDLTVAGYDGGGSSQSQPAFNLSSGSVTVGGTVAMTEAGSVSGPKGTQTFSIATGSQSGTLTVFGSPAFSLSANVVIDLDGANSTVVYAGGTQTILAVPYKNLTLANPGVKTFSGGGLSITGALSIEDGAVFSMPTGVSAASLYLDGERQIGNGKTYGGPGSGANFILSNYFSGPAKFKATATTLATTTTMSRTAGLSVSVYGTALTFHATVGVVGAGSIPDGDTVTFKSGSAVIGTAATSGNTADLTLYNLSVGSNQTITATYNGNVNFVFSTSAGVSQTVTPKALYIQGLSAAYKIYDGSVTADLRGTAALLSAEAFGGLTTDGHPYTGDAVSLSSTAAAAFTGTFPSTNAGIGVVVNISGNSLTSSQAGNYVLSTPDEANGTVTANVYAVPGTNSIIGLTHGATTAINAAGIAHYTYVMERSTNLSGGWTAVSTNTSDAGGSINATDTFSDLNGAIPPMAFYRLKWQP
jgi:hypothetical protein